MEHRQPQQTEQTQRPPRWTRQLLGELDCAPNGFTAARALIAHDIPVFPCAPGGKRPLTHHSFLEASTSASVAQGWWQRWPEANIGVPTGAAGGVDVVDVDVRGKDSGFSAFAQAQRAGLLDGWAWLVRTPSGGLHAYFLRPTSGDSDAQRCWQIPSRHVDFRGDGGYIIVPPSRVTGGDGITRSYHQTAITETHWPQAVDAGRLRRFLEPPRPSRPPRDLPSVGVQVEKLAAWVAARPEGGRNYALFWAACRMAEGGHDFNRAAALLGDAAVSAGLPEREAMTTIRSAYRIASRLGPTHPGRPTNAVAAVGL